MNFKFWKDYKIFISRKDKDMVTCKVCGEQFKSISITHLRKKHGIENIQEYYETYPGAEKNPNFFLGLKNTKEIEEPENNIDPLAEACLNSWGVNK